MGMGALRGLGGSAEGAGTGMGALRWLLLSALCIAVRGECDPSPALGTPRAGEGGGGTPSDLLPLRCRGGWILGKWFYCSLGPKICSSSKTQLRWAAKRAGALRAWWDWGRENKTKLRL